MFSLTKFIFYERALQMCAHCVAGGRRVLSQSKIRDFGGRDCAAKTEDGGSDHHHHRAADGVNNCTHERRHDELCYEHHAAHLQNGHVHNIPHVVGYRCIIIPQIHTACRRSHALTLTHTPKSLVICFNFVKRHCCSNCQRCFFEDGVA